MLFIERLNETAGPTVSVRGDNWPPPKPICRLEADIRSGRTTSRLMKTAFASPPRRGGSSGISRSRRHQTAGRGLEAARRRCAAHAAGSLRPPVWARSASRWHSTRSRRRAVRPRLYSAEEHVQCASNRSIDVVSVKSSRTTDSDGEREASSIDSHPSASPISSGTSTSPRTTTNAP